jgi:glycerophosphoryl diester phosphodiesterase
VAAFAFLDHPGPIPFAHQGGAREGPENTLAAFQKAVDLGFRYLETDAQLTKDRVLVALHDDSLDRTTDRRGKVADLTWDEVSQARVRDGLSGQLSDQGVPRLEDVFTRWPQARINVDAKDGRAVEPLIELVRRLGAIDRVCVGSFSPGRAGAMRRALGPALCTICDPIDVARLRLGGLGGLLGSVGGACAQVPVRQELPGPLPGSVPVVDEAFVRNAHRRGIAVHVWTIDKPADMHRLLDLGVDGIMTDEPSVLRQVLVDRGQWVGT